MNFSKRYGYAPEKAIQRESLDTATRNQLWDNISNFLCIIGSANDIYIWTKFFKKSRGEFPHSFIKNYRAWFFSCEWFSCYDFIEFLFENEDDFVKEHCDSNDISKDDFYAAYDNYRYNCCLSERSLNNILEAEACAYRIFKGRFTEITSEAEMIEVATALECKSHPVSEHLEKALGFLTDRKNPDYANSVKESIMAVETLCHIAVPEYPEATLGRLLKALKKHTKVHSTLCEAFEKLYGYACDEDGIRHVNINISEVDQPLAQYMLITCSAFINYVKVTIKLNL